MAFRRTGSFGRLHLQRRDLSIISSSPNKPPSQYRSKKSHRVLTQLELEPYNFVGNDFRIDVTEAEQKLFTTFLHASASMWPDDMPTIRVAGGWVRDRLIKAAGKQDVDIVLDKMSGREFAQCLHKWSVSQGFKPWNYAIFQENPEKSKHLETGMC